MAKSESGKTEVNNEIDLIDVFSRIGSAIGRGFSSIGRGILISIIFLFRNFLTLSLSVLLGAGISFVFKWLTKPVYESEMVFRSNTVPVSELLAYVNWLNQAAKDKNYNELAKKLSVSVDDATVIKKIEAYWIIDENVDSIPDYVDYRNKVNVYDTLIRRMGDRFQIKVRLRDPSKLQTIKSGLIKYVDSNEVFQLANEIRLKNNSELINRFNYEISLLDSLQKVKYFEETRRLIPDNEGQLVFLQEHKTQLLYEDIYLLYRRKHNLEEENKLYNGLLTTVIDFYQPVKRDNGAMFYGMIIIPFLFLTTLIMLIYSNNKKSIKDLLKKY